MNCIHIAEVIIGVWIAIAMSGTIVLVIGKVMEDRDKSERKYKGNAKFAMGVKNQ